MSVSNCCISQGSVATYLRCGGNYYARFVGNFFLFTAVQEFLKSVKIWQSYRQSLGPQFYFGTQGSRTFVTRCFHKVVSRSRNSRNKGHANNVGFTVNCNSVELKKPFPLVLWHCWLGDRKGIRPVKVTGCWFVGGDILIGALHDI